MTHISSLSPCTMYYIDVRYTLLVFFIIIFSSRRLERHFFFERTDKRQTTFSLIYTVFGKGENVIMALIVTVFTKFRTIVSHMVQLWNFPHIIFDGTVPFDLHIDFIPRITFYFFFINFICSVPRSRVFHNIRQTANDLAIN